ncbi:MAG TPA: glycyl-radical enzyme activating protein [Syntrophorhabdaceae bacterium]|nr:glycyl-radical enzyme activating protein [Syntrophorhabdaceae bacterium]
MDNKEKEIKSVASEDGDIKGVVFNIQRYSIHDGPGIRTTVFLKGCPLSCVWCQNPESQALKPELFYNRERCVGCGRCIAVCPVNAIEMGEGKVHTDRNLCTACGHCVDVCPEEAREVMGKVMTAKEVVGEVMKDAIFYKNSGGGVTISGGDPFAQPAFSAAILKFSREEGIHTAIETCGLAPWITIEKILPYVDLVLYDMKHMNTAEHKRLTGVSNELILENAKRIFHEKHIPLVIRVPVVPGYNDSADNMDTLATFVVHELSPFLQIHLLPYHRLGESKIEQLERDQSPLNSAPPDEERMLSLKQIMEERGLKKVIIGG